MISGYNFQCDIHQLSQSYKEMKCFKNCEKLLDIQNVYKEPRGGLAGLAEVRIYDVVLVFRVFGFSRSSICGGVMIKAPVLIFFIALLFFVSLTNRVFIGKSESTWY